MNGNLSMEAHQGVVPLTIRMTNELKVEGNQTQYDSINLTMISIIGRFYKVSKEQNQIRYSIVINDDSGILKASYYSKRNDDDPIKNMLDNELDDMNYYEFILQVKVFKDAPYFILQNFILTSVNVWMFHTMKIIQLEQVSRPKIDWNELKKQPLDIQIEGYIRYYKKVNITQLLKQFNCSLQQLKVHIEQLKKRSAIAECLNKETFRIFN